MGPTCLLWLFCFGSTLISSGYSNGGLPRISAEDRSTQTALVGQNVQLSCPVDKNPEIMVEWYKDGQQIFVAWDRFKTNRKGLRIRNVTYDDQGTYVCKAINGYGSDEVSIGLIIRDDADYDTDSKDPSLNEGNHYPVISSGSAPVITDSIRNHGPNFQRPVGGNLRLKCAASGNPSPQISWIKDGQEIRAKEKRLSQWMLVLADLQTVDTGQYTCIATNIHGSANTTFSVQVIDRFRDKPELTGAHPSNTTVPVGGTASFQCKVRSDVFPHIQWLKQLDDPSEAFAQNKTIQVGEYHYRVLKSSEAINCADGSFLNKLVISRVKESDSGVYICLAANTMGYSFRSAYLVVPPPSILHRDATHSMMSHDKISVGVIVIIALVGLIACIVLMVCYIRWRPKQSPPSTTSHQRCAEVPLKSSEPKPLTHTPTAITTSLNNKKTPTTTIANGVCPSRTLPSTYIHQNSNRIPADCLESTWVDMPSRTHTQSSSNSRVVWAAAANGHPQTQYYHCKRAAAPPGGGVCAGGLGSEPVDYRSGSAGSGGGSGSMAKVYHHKHSHCHCNR